MGLYMNISNLYCKQKIVSKREREVGWMGRKEDGKTDGNVEERLKEERWRAKSTSKPKDGFRRGRTGLNRYRFHKAALKFWEI